MIINGKEIKTDEGMTLESYLKSNGYRLDRIAVELNGEIRTRNDFAGISFSDSDVIEIVSFVGGG